MSQNLLVSSVVFCSRSTTFCAALRKVAVDSSTSHALRTWTLLPCLLPACDMTFRQLRYCSSCSNGLMSKGERMS